MRNYKLIDYLTQGYVALVGVLVLLFHDESVPNWGLHVAGHAGLLVLVHGIVWLDGTRGGSWIRMLRAFYPLGLYAFLYAETHHLDGMFFEHAFDGWVIDLDQRLFGQQPCRTLMERFPSVIVSEVLHGAYFSYYIMVVGVGVALYVSDRKELCRYVTTVSFLFYTCYLTYIFFPVLGPAATETGETLLGALGSVGPRDTPEGISTGPFFQIMAFVYAVAEPTGGAAFPSSHVAIAVTTLVFTWQRLPRARWVHLIATVLLCIATVYCGYHYASDVLAGLVVAVVLVPLAMGLHRWCGSLPQDQTCSVSLVGSRRARAQ